MANQNSTHGQRVVVRPDGSIGTEDFSPREPMPGEVLIETIATLISAGTELGMQEQKRSVDIYPGYSNVGRILIVGDGVQGYTVGDIVMSLGSHASHVTVSAAPQSLAPVPKGISLDEATFGVLGSVSMHGVRRAKPELGEFIAITGMGIVGQLALQIAAQAGCEAIIAVDLSNMRLKIAQEHGATHIVNPRSDNLCSLVSKLTDGRGLDLIIEASGYPELLPQAFDIARIGGRIAVLGSIWHRKVEVDFMDFHEKELTLFGCHQPKCPIIETPAFRWTQPYNRRQILKMIADGRLDVKSLITCKLPYTEAAEAYRLLRDERDKALGIILDWQKGTDKR